jgi:hypothetical protein
VGGGVTLLYHHVFTLVAGLVSLSGMGRLSSTGMLFWCLRTAGDCITSASFSWEEDIRRS